MLDKIYHVFGMLFVIFFRILTVETFYEPSQDHVSEDTRDTLKFTDKLFSDCTLHFPESNTSNNPNITAIEIDLEQFSNTVKLLSTLFRPQVTSDYLEDASYNFSNHVRYNFNSDLSQIFWKVFSVQKFCLPCTARVISTTNDFGNSLDSSIENLTPYIFPGLYEYRYDEDWDENSYMLRKINPDYVLGFLPVLNENTLYFLISPESMASSKIIVITENLCYLNCFVCSKWRLLLGNYISENFLNYYRMSRVSVFVNFSNFIKESTKKLIDSTWLSINGNLQGFGMPLGSKTVDKKSNGQSCSEKLLKGIPETMSHYPEQNCIIYVILEHLNCTSYSCRRHLVLNLNYYSSIVNENFGGSDHAIAHGAQWDGLRFSLVLGQHEGRRGYAGLGAISRPLSWNVWLCIGLSIFFMTAAVLKISGVLGIGRILLWVIGSIFENNGALNIQLGFVIGWTFACFFARNLYTSVLYSHLTKQPNPENVPENMKQLFRNDSQWNTVIFADASVSYQILNHMGVLEGRTDGNLDGFEQIVNKLKLIWINLNTTEFIRNISSMNGIDCRDMVTETYKVEKCNVEGRFALLYNIIGWRTKSSPRFVKPMISLFGGRKLVENVNSPSILNEPVLWFTVDRFFYLESFQSTLAQLFESGIQSTFKIRYETGLVGNITKIVNLEGKFGFKGNLLKFTEKVVSRTGYVGEDDSTKEMIWGDNEKVSLRDVWVATVLWLYGLIGCMIGATLEQVWWSRDNR